MNVQLNKNPIVRYCNIVMNFVPKNRSRLDIVNKMYLFGTSYDHSFQTYFLD